MGFETAEVLLAGTISQEFSQWFATPSSIKGQMSRKPSYEVVCDVFVFKRFKLRITPLVGVGDEVVQLDRHRGNPFSTFFPLITVQYMDRFRTTSLIYRIIHCVIDDMVWGRYGVVVMITDSKITHQHPLFIFLTCEDMIQNDLWEGETIIYK